MLSRLFIAALWSPAGKGLTSWLLFVMFYCVFFTFTYSRLVVIFQETARNHFWEAGMLMQSYMLETVQ